MKYLFAFLILCFAVRGFSQSVDESTIRTMMARQEDDWNKGDIQSFMDGYWKSDSLQFIGKSGITYGWENTLANYRKGYPDTAAMGRLTFTLIHLKPLSTLYFHVTGKWKLTRAKGDAGGYFTLLLKKIDGKWVIICDHSS